MLFPIAVQIHQKLSEYLLNVKAGTAYQTFFFHLVLILQAQHFCIKHSVKEMYVLKCNRLPLKESGSFSQSKGKKK